MSEGAFSHVAAEMFMKIDNKRTSWRKCKCKIMSQDHPCHAYESDSIDGC